MDSELPQRVPFPRSRGTYRSLPAQLLERYRAALRRWADAPEPPTNRAYRSLPPSMTVTEAIEMSSAGGLFRTESTSGTVVEWFVEQGVIHVARIQFATGRIIELPGSPDLGMCFETMPRDVWNAIREAWEGERSRRRGTRWSCQENDR